MAFRRLPSPRRSHHLPHVDPEASLAAERLREHVHAEYDVNANARHLLTHYRSAGGA